MHSAAEPPNTSQTPLPLTKERGRISLNQQTRYVVKPQLSGYVSLPFRCQRTGLDEDCSTLALLKFILHCVEEGGREYSIRLLQTS